jgi:hypothetical protein
MRTGSSSDFEGEPEEQAAREISNEIDEVDSQARIEPVKPDEPISDEGPVNPIRTLVDKFFPDRNVKTEMTNSQKKVRSSSAKFPKPTNEAIRSKLKSNWESSDFKQKFEYSLSQLA